MLDLLLLIAGIVVSVGIALILVGVALTAAGGVALGTLLERIGDLLIPGRKTGLGADGIVEQQCVITRALEPQGDAPACGTIQVAGELWKACSADGQPLPRGTRARVVRVEGMLAIVAADPGWDQVRASSQP